MTKKAYAGMPRDKLPAGVRRPTGTARSPLFAAGREVIQAAVLTDDKGGRWCVVVAGGGEQVSTIAWPAGSPSLSTIVCGFALQFAHGIQPPSRLQMPDSQPAYEGKTIPLHVVLDGITQHASLTIDSSGVPHGWVEGWQRIEGSMSWGEIGRYGYRNVSVDVPPHKSLPHPERIATMRFMPDGRIATADTARLAVIDPADGTSKVIDRSADSKRFYHRWRLSPDGRFFIVPDKPLRGVSVVDLLSGEQRRLADVPLKDFSRSDFGFESPQTVLMIEHFHLARLGVEGKSVGVFDVIADGSTLKIVPSTLLASEKQGARSFPIFSAAGNTLAIGHSAGIFVLSKDGDGWSDARRLDDWTGASISLSPDGRWLVKQQRLISTVYDVKSLAPVAEFSGEFFGNGAEMDRVSWSADGSLVALTISGGRLGLCTLDERKLAVELLTASPAFKETFQGAFCLSPDGKFLASKLNDDQTLNIWRVADVFEQAQKVTPGVSK